MMRRHKSHSRILFMLCVNMKTFPLNKMFGCLLGFLLSPLLSFFPLHPLLPFSRSPSSSPFDSPLSHCLPSLISLPPAGPHLPFPFGGSLLLISCPVCPPPIVAWTILPSSATAELNTGRLSIYFLPSHDSCLFIPSSMSLLRKDSFHHSASEFEYGSPDSVSFLLNVVAGIGGGRLLGIPWHDLPLIRAFVKERLALSAFFLCHCSYPSVSWGSVGTTLSCEDGLVRVLGCLCTG